MPQNEITKTASSQEKDAIQQIKEILSPFKGRLWLSFAIYGALTTIGLSVGLLAWNLSDFQANPTEQTKKKFDASLELVKGGITAIGTVATIAAGVVLYLNFRVATLNAEIAQKKLEQETEKARVDAKLAESRLRVDRFSKAVELLGKDSIHLRLGGIYALEGIADDSNPDAPDEDYRQVLEVLTAFVRENSPWPPKEQGKEPIAQTQATVAGEESRKVLPPLPIDPQTAQVQPAVSEEEEKIPPLPTDVEAVLTVLKRRLHRDRDWEKYPIDLSKTNLRGANLMEVNLPLAILKNTNLQEANLIKANLQGADLYQANLQKVHLNGAHLQGTCLMKAKLQGAWLRDTHLQKADLVGTNLQEAVLIGTNLHGAVLLGANFRGAYLWKPGLTETNLVETKDKARANIQSARYWEAAEYDPEIREWLGLPPETVQAKEA